MLVYVKLINNEDFIAELDENIVQVWSERT